MTSQPIEANVVLTADNSGYDAAMMESSTATEKLMNSVDQLTGKISKLTKTAGKSLIGIAAADVAMITGATAAWNAYEKQMERLRSQANILGRTNKEQSALMKDYTASVKSLRSEMGVTTTEAAKLNEVLTKVTSIRQSRDLGEISKTFIQMSKATGESSLGLANSMTALQKMFGDPINARTTKQYADQFTYLAAHTNTSAEGLMNFTAQLAPVAKQLGMSEKQVAGFATAFTRVGADTGAAGTAFTKFTSDILRSLETGSPELAHYANIVGMTQQSFKNLARSDAAEATVRIFEALGKNTRTATVEMERLGLDGPRTIRQITQMINEPGGIRAGLGLVEAPGVKGATGRGYAATMEGLSNQFDEIREDVKQTAEAFATILGPALEGVLVVVEKFASGMQNLAEGPIGQFLEVIMGIIAPLAGGAGALLLFAGALFKVAAAFLAIRNSMSRGVIEGFRGGAPITRTAEGAYIGRGGALLGTGAALAAGATSTDPRAQSSWIQRGMYNVGIYGGQGLAAFRPGGQVPQNWYAAREALSAHIPWTQQYQRPTTAMSPLERMSRAGGWVVSNLVTPQFDQMRYQDPSMRRTWAAQEAPWIRAGDTMRTAAGRMRILPGLVSAMGGVGLAETQLKGVRQEMLRTQQDPLLTQQARDARMQELRQIREETKERLASSRSQERAIRDEITRRGEASGALRTATTESKTFGQAMRGLARGMAGGMWGGLQAGAGAAWRTGMVGQAGALGAMTAGGMMGSNALMLGGTGAMIGSMIAPGPGTAIGAAVGGGIGLAMDVAKANDKVTDSIKNLDQMATESSKSGSGINALHESTVQSQKDLDEWSEKIGASGDRMEFWFGKPKWEYFKTAIPSVKNLVEGWVGKSDVEEAQEELDKTTEKAQNAEAAFRDLAKQGGEKLTGSETRQRQQIEQFMAAQGAEALGKAGIEVEDFVKAREAAEAGGAGSEAQRKYQQMLRQAIEPGRATGMYARIRTTEAGEVMMESEAARKSLRLRNDVAAFYDGTNEIFTNMRKQGMSYLDIVESTLKTQSKIGDAEEQASRLQAAAMGKAQYAIQMQAPQLGRMGAFQQQMELTQRVMTVKPTTPQLAEVLEQSKQAAAQAWADTDAYFRQLLLADQAYERSRERAQDDFALQQEYQLYDYTLQRDRAEESFNRMRARAVADYHRSVTRAWADFNLQRKRQEEDYQHQLDITAQQAAIGTNLYQRTQTQRTSSATWLLSNTKDILQRLREQKQNLNRLRELGFSDAVIQQLQLGDPANAQELSRFVTEVESDRAMVGRFNRVAGQLTRASRALVTDESSLEFQEMERSFRLNRDRGMEDMRRNMRRGREDFRRGLRQQREDFNIMMDDQAEDFEEQQRRQLKQYNTTMDRAAEDMAHMADEITGSLEEVLVQAHKDLTGSAKKQAGIALQSFKDLRTSTKPEAIALMRELSEIFGFEYKVPKGANMGGGGGGAPSSGHPTNPTWDTYNPHAGSTSTPGGPAYIPSTPTAGGAAGFHEGGVMPGYTPGRDIYNITVSGGEGILRPEATRAMGGRGAINAINHLAKYGGFASGGVFWPVPGHQTGTYPGHDGVDINRGSGSDDYGDPIRAFRKGVITYVGSGHGYGDAIFERTAAGTVVYGHTSAQYVHAGQRVAGGALIGRVGSTGNSSAPHLHFGIPGGTYSQAMALLAGAIVGGGPMFAAGAMMGAIPRLADIMKDRYPDAERAAAGMTGVHPLQPGMISGVINSMLRQRYRMERRRARRMGLVAGPGMDAGIGDQPNENLNNQQIVHTGANRMGWGNQWPSLYQLVMHESGFSNTAQNPTSTAYGMFQFLDSTWDGYGKKTSDPWQQTQAGLRYIKARYGNPNKAWDFWQAHHWYKDGSLFTSPNTIGVGENGPEAVIPLNERGADFMTDVMGSIMGGRHVARMGGAVSVQNFRIDRSTNFTGPITVQANDPNELLAKLQARQRVRALSRPSLTGSAA